jgi:hypothetical protein
MKRIFIIGIAAVCCSCSSGTLPSPFSMSNGSNAGSSETDQAVVQEAAQREELDAGSYTQWFEEGGHGLLAEKEINGYRYSLLYKPASYETLKMYNDQLLTTEELKAVPELQYYTLRILKENLNDELLKDGVRDAGEYGRRVEYFSYQVQQDIRLVDGADTLSCAMVHYERTYGVSPGITLLLSFPLKDKEKVKHPVYEQKTLAFDDEVFGNGRVNLTIDAASLNRMPELAFTE